MSTELRSVPGWWRAHGQRHRGLVGGFVSPVLKQFSTHVAIAAGKMITSGGFG